MILRASATHIPLADESVQCVVTSPPYWGLRKYAGEQELVWGGADGCEHEWLTSIVARVSGGGDRPPDNKWKTGPLIDTPSQTDTCRLCGAWRGAYGLEPTVEMYVEHSVQILREVRRVLRKDGVCFLNLGDSYASGGTRPIQFRREGRAPACGNDGTGFLDWMESGCACSCHDDERSDASCLRTVHSDQLLGQDALQPCTKGHDSGLSDSSSASLGDVPLGAQASSTPASLQSSQANHAVRFCSDCLSFHYSASYSSLSGTLYHVPELKPKDLCLIPFRVALAAQADGWWVRSVIIWAKPNPMPESCKDRPTDAYEHILMLTKSARYFWDAEAVKEPAIGQTEHDLTGQGYAAPGQAPSNGNRDSWHGSRFDRGKTADHQGHRMQVRDNSELIIHNSGRNLRNVWTFPTQPYAEAHFATFPEELPRRCIKAATSERGACVKCGAPWERIIEPDAERAAVLGKGYHDHTDDLGRGQRNSKPAPGGYVTTGWRPTCDCGTEETRPCIVLDPFGGSGTTARVALELNRRPIILDLAYQELQKKRTGQVQPELALI